MNVAPVVTKTRQDHGRGLSRRQELTERVYLRALSAQREQSIRLHGRVKQVCSGSGQAIGTDCTGGFYPPATMGKGFAWLAVGTHEVWFIE